MSKDPNRIEDNLRNAIVSGRRRSTAPVTPDLPAAESNAPAEEPRVTQPSTPGTRRRVILEGDAETIKALQESGQRVIELGGDNPGPGAGNGPGPNRPRRRSNGFRPWRALRRLGLWLGVPLLAGIIAIGPVMNSPDIGSRYDAARQHSAQQVHVLLTPEEGRTFGDIFRPAESGIPDANAGAWTNYKNAWLHGMADMVDDVTGSMRENIEHRMIEEFPQEKRDELLSMISHIKSNPATGKPMGEYNIVDSQPNGALTIKWTNAEGVEMNTEVPATFAHNIHFLALTEHMLAGGAVTVYEWDRDAGHMLAYYDGTDGERHDVYIHPDNVDKYRMLHHRVSHWDSPFSFELSDVAEAKERFSYLMSLVRTGTELNIAKRADNDGFDITYTSGKTGDQTTYHLSEASMAKYRDMFNDLRSAKAAMESQRDVAAPSHTIDAAPDRVERQPAGPGLRPGVN